MPFMQVYENLFNRYGPQQWWPADTPFEVMIGAILTQNTAWTNVEKAINNLKQHQLLDYQSIIDCPGEFLAELIRPSGYFNMKAQRLKNFCHWLLEQGGEKCLTELETTTLRSKLLSVHGIGPETADDILLYAFQRPVFVIDAYTRRIFSRLKLVDAEMGYEPLREIFEEKVVSSEKIYNEYHALIVVHAKQHCQKRPSCEGCCLYEMCHFN